MTTRRNFLASALAMAATPIVAQALPATPEKDLEEDLASDDPMHPSEIDIEPPAAYWGGLKTWWENPPFGLVPVKAQDAAFDVNK